MIELNSPCKINLVLNILGRREDGFHELETLMVHVPVHDVLRLELAGQGIELSCGHPGLPVDSTNLVWKAADAFFKALSRPAGVRIQLEKRIPMAAGLGGGSGNAATTLRGLNRMMGDALSQARLVEVAATLGSDVPFFLQEAPALAVGRGEKVESLPPLPVLSGKGLFLAHPGFGISTPWAYQQLSRFPDVLRGRPGRAREWADAALRGDSSVMRTGLYNSLEAPALDKFPVLRVYQEFLLQQGALGALMSGSGSTTFAFFESVAAARAAEGLFRERFTEVWTHSCEL